MSVFNPELKEYSESNFEEKKFSPEIEKRILQEVKKGKEKFPGIIQCPNQSCGSPLKVEVQADFIRLYCTNDGWERMLRRT